MTTAIAEKAKEQFDAWWEESGLLLTCSAFPHGVDALRRVMSACFMRGTIIGMEQASSIMAHNLRTLAACDGNPKTVDVDLDY